MIRARSHPFVAAWAGPALVVAAGIGLAAWSWGKWLHPLVDFGREIYLPWQIVEGRLLYRDLAYFNGPLSPYLNAVGLAIFGVGLRTLLLLNLAVLTAVVALAYRLIRRHADRLTATTGCLFFLVVFAFADSTGWGNYNFAAPYSHELTHGTLLSLAALALVLRYVERGRRLDLAAAGVATGLVWLTKAELFLALAPVVVLGALLAPRPDGRRQVARLAALASGFAAPVGLVFLLASLADSGATAFPAILGSWPYLFEPELTSQRFYRSGMGLLDPRASVTALAGWLLVWLAALAPGAAAAWWGRGRGRWWPAVAAALATGTIAFLALQRYGPGGVARPVPLVLLLLLLPAAAALRQRRRDPRALASLLAVLWALGLLAKMPLYTRFHHYGFALAAPAALVLIVALLFELPRRVERRGGAGRPLRAAGVAFLAVVAAAFLTASAASYARKVHPVGEGADRFLADRGGLVMNLAIARLAPLTGEQPTLAVVPDVSMLNYLLRLDNPTPYTNLLPPEFLIFGERQIVSAFRSRPPDLVVLTRRPLGEYGSAGFGVDFGGGLVAFLRPRYREVERIEPPGLGPREVPQGVSLFAFEGVESISASPHLLWPVGGGDPQSGRAASATGSEGGLDAPTADR